MASGYAHNAHMATGNLDPMPITAKEILGDTTGASLRRNLTPVMGRWTFGLFDCCDDPDVCCGVFFCPCCAYGAIHHMEETAELKTVCGGCGEHCNERCMVYCILDGTCRYLPFGPACANIWLGPQTLVYLSAASCYACDTRRKLRAKFNLPEQGECCKNDCCTHYWCSMCALCQEYRELRARIVEKDNLQPAYIAPGAQVISKYT